MPSYRIVDNDDPRFPDHVLIEAVEDDGTVSSRSWAPADVDPAVRLSLDHPEAEDRRKGAAKGAKVSWRLPTVAEVRAMGMADNDDAAAEHVRRIAFVASERSRAIPATLNDDLAARAGSTPAAIRDEAGRKGW